ncbi:MAG: SDR family oxidoreductase [Sphingomonadales bacterium]|nr:MAG: SDR family oxidoreductase [Sphingomonadales bacterium]
MDGKVAIVTGGGQGLGRAVAQALSSAGYRVAVFGRTRSKLDETVALLPKPGLAVAVDLTDPQGVREAFAAVETAFGQIDALVNNAATYLPFLMGEASDNDLRATVDGTLMSALFCIREAIPRMTGAGGGEIVTVTSESVHMPAPFLSLYAACKAALVTVHQGLRNELRGTGIRPMIFETGRITETSVAEHWSPEIIARFHKVYVEQGYSSMISAEGVTPATLAATIAHMIQAPREATIDTVHIRSGI